MKRIQERFCKQWKCFRKTWLMKLEMERHTFNVCKQEEGKPFDDLVRNIKILS